MGALPDFSAHFAEVRAENMQTVRPFLAKMFGTGIDAPFLNEELMRWKCHEPRPDWPSSRAFTIARNGRVLAYSGIVPMTWLTLAGPVRALVPIDWAADRLVPGAGAILHRKLSRLAEVVLQIGGTSEARKVAPLLGLKKCCELVSYVRVVRPWRQARLRPERDWKALPRAARNAIWSASAARSMPAEWSAAAVDRFDDSMLPAAPPDLLEFMTPCARTAGVLNYMLRCPGATITGFSILRSGSPQGWFLLSRVGAQVRIADLFIPSNDSSAWNSGYSVALRTAMRDPAACEVVAAASSSLARDAILANGFRPRESDPVWIGDPHGRLDGGAPLHLSMLESDAAYLFNPDHPFLA
jgi:hypothetical protein